MKKRKLILSKVIVSLLGVGYLKPLSATWGSLASGIILYLFWPSLELWMKAIIIIITFCIGAWLADKIEKSDKLHDPHFIVIDEVVGMMIVTLFLTQEVWIWAMAFVLFRVFDIAKLWPASVFDKKTGGFFIMIDDVIMAIPALLFLQLILNYL